MNHKIRVTYTSYKSWTSKVAKIWALSKTQGLYGPLFWVSWTSIVTSPGLRRQHFSRPARANEEACREQRCAGLARPKQSCPPQLRLACYLQARTAAPVWVNDPNLGLESCSHKVEPLRQGDGMSLQVGNILQNCAGGFQTLFAATASHGQPCYDKACLLEATGNPCLVNLLFSRPCGARPGSRTCSLQHPILEGNLMADPCQGVS